MLGLCLNPVQYLTIHQAILEQIESGQLEARQKLPAERKLAELFNTTRVTLREALALLETDGKLYREDRRGWFISPPPFVYDPGKLIGFEQRAQQLNRRASHRLLSAQSGLATKEASALMTLPPFSDLFTVTRLRELENRAVCYVTSMLLPRVAPTLLDTDFTDSLSTTLRDQFNLEVVKIEYRASVTSLVGDIATSLNATHGATAVKVTRYFYDKQHSLIGCSEEYWRHDALVLNAETTFNTVT